MVGTHKIQRRAAQPFDGKAMLLACLDMIEVNKVHGVRQECAAHEDLLAADDHFVRKWDD